MPSITRNEGVSGSSPLIGSLSNPLQIAGDARSGATPGQLRGNRRATIPPLLVGHRDAITTWIGRLLLAAIVVLIAALLMAYDPSLSHGGSVDEPVVDGRDAAVVVGAPRQGHATAPLATDTRHANPLEQSRARDLPSPRARLTLGTIRRWARATATWYGPGFYGNRTACGQRYTIRTRGVAVPSGGRYHLPCGHRLTICFPERRRCVRVKVIDTGSFRNHRFDLSARSAMDLCRCWRPYTMRVRWQHGWRRA